MIAEQTEVHKSYESNIQSHFKQNKNRSHLNINSRQDSINGDA